jgi:hypothetical protein
MFQFEQPGIADTMICIAAGLLTITWFEVYKAVNFRRTKRSVSFEDHPKDKKEES